MAASFKLSPYSSPPLLLNPKSRSSPHLLKPFPSPPLSSPRFSSLKRSNLFDRRGLGFLVHAVKNDGGMDPPSPAPEEQSGGESTMPERFRYLTREAPDRPVRWPWVIALFFLVYCWRTVLWELSNWKKAALAILHFFGYLSKLALAFVFPFVGDPITGFIRIIESSLYLVRDIYFSIIAFAPVPELTRIILFASTILAIGEAAVPDSVNSQPYLLTFAGIIGFGAVKGVILEPFFWLFLVGIFCFSRFIKKRDSTSAALPSAAVLAAIGEPWVRGLTIVSYLALAIVQNSKSSEEAVNVEVSLKQRKLPLPLLLAALSIGIHVAAKWIRYRHLRWMIA